MSIYEVAEVLKREDGYKGFRLVSVTKGYKIEQISGKPAAFSKKEFATAVGAARHIRKFYLGR